LTLPTATGIVTQNFSLTRAVAVTTSPFTFQTQVHQHQGEFWRTVISLPPMLRANANIWLSFLLQLRGRRGTFKIGDQDAKTITGAATGTIRVNGASQTGNQVALDGFANSTSNVFKAGDYIQIGSYLYMVIEDVSSNASGEADVKIEPALRSSLETIADDTTVIYSNTTTIMRLDTNELGWQTDKVSKYGISFSASEAL
jgi:3D (Asp-Asp-Asp) domain-containing protein